MTQPESLSRLLRLALDSQGEEATLRRLTRELVRQGYNDPPKPTDEDIEAAARNLTALFPHCSPQHWQWWPAIGELFYRFSSEDAQLSIKYDKLDRISHGLRFRLILSINRPTALDLPPLEFRPSKSTTSPFAMRRALQLAVDPNACEDKGNTSEPTILTPERLQAWRVLWRAMNTHDGLNTNCPRCGDSNPDLSLIQPLCGDCRMAMADEPLNTTVNNYGMTVPPALALAVANRHFDLTRPGATWSAAPNPNLISDMLQQARALQVEHDRANFHLRPNPDQPHILERVTELHITPGDAPFDTIRIPPETVDRLNQHLISLRRGYFDQINEPLRQELSGLGLTPEQVNQLLDDDT